ncbi:hypothetical protein KC19_3G133900 [Ceratodon purpureus]|uniref:Aldose 1-epimerase n=1 Tax=Ceratodon purpureus TaxID=3225 RepID=A0A8T0II20_CERPU|nr:hypothetical protein KC19_3G133900 [Ceratodon purpureus]
MGVSKGTVTEECVGDGLFFYTLERGGVRAVFSNWGATLISLCVPDAQGEIGDIVLGFDTLGPYMDGTSPYFGAIVGRVANRIARGTFILDGERFVLPINNGPNSLHGGHIGFDKVLWEARKVTDSNGPSVQFFYHSHDGEQGYPGDLDVSITYTLSSDNELRTEMEAKPVNKATPINLAQHSYFNLSGHGSGDVLQHRVRLWSTHYTPLDETQIPTGEVAPVQGTPFDFTEEASIGSRFNEVPGGYDHNFDLRSGLADPAGDMNGEDTHEQGLRIAAKVWDPVSKRAMEVFTTAPGVQFYTGNFLDGIMGKAGAVYNAQAGLCLETQGFPNAVNEPRFPSIIYRPGETYRHVMVHKFYTQS